MNREELKPCPFCGGKAELRRSKAYLDDAVQIHCTQCNVLQPYFFGDPWKKKTCLWLKKLPTLQKTDVVTPTGKWVRHHLKNKNDLEGYAFAGVYSAKERSKTFIGIAKAMADQWG